MSIVPQCFDCFSSPRKFGEQSARWGCRVALVTPLNQRSPVRSPAPGDFLALALIPRPPSWLGKKTRKVSKKKVEKSQEKNYNTVVQVIFRYLK